MGWRKTDPLAPRGDEVRPTIRCLSELQLTLPVVNVPLELLDHPLVVKAQRTIEIADAGGAERISELDDRCWWKVKVQAWRGVATDLPPGLGLTEGGGRWWLDAEVAVAAIKAIRAGQRVPIRARAGRAAVVRAPSNGRSKVAARRFGMSAHPGGRSSGPPTSQVGSGHQWRPAAIPPRAASSERRLELLRRRDSAAAVTE